MVSVVVYLREAVHEEQRRQEGETVGDNVNVVVEAVIVIQAGDVEIRDEANDGHDSLEKNNRNVHSFAIVRRKTSELVPEEGQ